MDAPKQYQTILPCRLDQVFRIDLLLAGLHIENRERGRNSLERLVVPAVLVCSSFSLLHPCDTTAVHSVVRGLVLHIHASSEGWQIRMPQIRSFLFSGRGYEGDVHRQPADVIFVVALTREHSVRIVKNMGYAKTRYPFLFSEQSSVVMDFN